MSLREKIQNLPKAPGVYFMKDQKGKIIYVGKAKNLKNRVSSYFQKTEHSVKTQALVKEIRDFDLMVVKTEVEALLLERSMIRHHQPYYNILLRDDKEYPFVRINYRDPWPRLQKVRKRRDDGASYIGPFANAGVLNGMLKTVMRVFPLIRCSPHEFANAKRPCNYYHMNMCLAPCVLEVNRQEYLAMLQQAAALLDGKNKSVKAQIKKKMLAASQEQDFEKAAGYRDQIKVLNQIGQHQRVVVKDFEEADAINYWEYDGKLTFNVTLVRNYVVIASDDYIVGSSIDTIEETLESFLLQYYHNRSAPQSIILPVRLEGQEDLIQVIGEGQQEKCRFVFKKSGDPADLLELSAQNARFFSEQNQALQLKQRAELQVLKDTLKLTKFPHRIECIDISNMQGQAIVASNVCFLNGKPAKEHYRRYNIRTVADKNDDFASIREVVQRRLERGLKDDDLPDLLVIDGGKGQLSAALEAAQLFPSLRIPIVSLAKSRPHKFKLDAKDYQPSQSLERIFLPDFDAPIPLEVGSPAFRLMTNLRDEAHRFAISFHRKKRQEAGIRSILDDIPGVGPVIKKRLLDTFGDLEAISRASLEQLNSVQGLKKSTALAIHAKLREDDRST